jgi:hypothetical protein
MRRIRARNYALMCAVTLLALLDAGSPSAAVQPGKASRTCRKELGSKLGKVAQVGFTIVDACHKSRDKGKFSGDCNDLTVADTKGKVASVEAAALKGITKKCLAGDPVLFNYALGQPDTAFFPVAEDAAESAGTALLGSPALQGDKAKIKCHAAISKAALKDVGEILKNAVKCQQGVDKLATTFVELDGDCVATPVKSGLKGEAAIAKACLGITGADVGSCDPLPGCVTAAATTRGQALAAAIYGQPIPGCGNHIVDAGEECDDGNDIETDDCVACKLATCGDGFVHAGVELCGDALTDACTSPSENTCQVTPCGGAGTLRTVTVRFTKPANQVVGGLVIALDYPETQVRIPNQDLLDRVTVVPSGLPTIIDREYEVQVSVVSFGPIDPGDFYSVQFDDCAAVTAPTLDEFACLVRSASDDVGGDITNDVHCTVTSP